ncbi:hypothetical protein ACLBW0_23950 [Enterobacteriaceae bacterium C34A]
MNSKTWKSIILLVCALPALAFPNIERGVGYWAVKCGGFGGFVEIESSNEVKVNVNDNNLYISGSIQEGNDGHLSLFYKDVLETMSDTIDWAVISQSKPIADITFKNGTMHIKWEGFFDTKLNDYIWKSEPDFVVASGSRFNVVMNKCNFQ